MKVTIKYDPDHKLAKRYFLEPASRLDGITGRYRAALTYLKVEDFDTEGITLPPPAGGWFRRLLTPKHKSDRIQ